MSCMIVTTSVNLESSKSLTDSSASLKAFSQTQIAYLTELLISQQKTAKLRQIPSLRASVFKVSLIRGFYISFKACLYAFSQSYFKAFILKYHTNYYESFAIQQRYLRQSPFILKNQSLFLISSFSLSLSLSAIFFSDFLFNSFVTISITSPQISLIYFSKFSLYWFIIDLFVPFAYLNRYADTALQAVLLWLTLHLYAVENNFLSFQLVYALFSINSLANLTISSYLQVCQASCAKARSYQKFFIQIIKKYNKWIWELIQQENGKKVQKRPFYVDLPFNSAYKV